MQSINFLYLMIAQHYTELMATVATFTLSLHILLSEFIAVGLSLEILVIYIGD